MTVEERRLLLVRLDLMRRHGECPECGGSTRVKPMTFTTYYRCTRRICGYELAVSNGSGLVREPKWFGWGGD